MSTDTILLELLEPDKLVMSNSPLISLFLSPLDRAFSTGFFFFLIYIFFIDLGCLSFIVSCSGKSNRKEPSLVLLPFRIFMETP